MQLSNLIFLISLTFHLLFEVEVSIFLCQPSCVRLGILSCSAIGDNHGTVLTAHFHSGRGRAGWHDDKHWNTELWGVVSNSHGKVTVWSHNHPLSLLILKNRVAYCTFYIVTKLSHMILDHSNGLTSFFSSTSWSYYDTIIQYMHVWCDLRTYTES